MNRSDGTRAANAPDAGGQRRPGRAVQEARRLLPPLLTGLLLWASFPPLEWPWLAWVALVPLTTLVAARPRSRPIYLPAWCGGLLFGLLAVHWIRYADDTGLTGYYGWLMLALYLSLYFPAFLLLARMAVLGCRLPGILAVPVVWVGLEYLRGRLYCGFPWYLLGHTQYRWIELIQVADLTGTYGVSFAVALVNGWLFDLLSVPLLHRGGRGLHLSGQQVWRAALALAVIAGVLGYGAWRAESQRFEPGPKLALIQTNVPQHVKVDRSKDREIYAGYLRLLRRAAEAKPDMVVWPETAFRHYLLAFAAGLTDADLRRLYPQEQPAELRQAGEMVRRALTQWSKGAGTDMLMGINAEQVHQSGSRLYNAAVLVGRDGRLGPQYHKIYLVPWGEYLPLKDWLPWLHALTPHASADYGLEAGTEPVRFHLGPYRFGVLICFEDTLPWAARAYVATAPVDFLVNISNDGWFCGSAELDVHLAISVFRAVECRRPLVRAVNTGVSAIIDGNGRIVAVTGAGTGPRKRVSDVLVGRVPLDGRWSLYGLLGDWLGAAALGALPILAGYCLTRRRQFAARRQP